MSKKRRLTEKEKEEVEAQVEARKTREESWRHGESFR